jgi:methenyltetrahydromethanopterin cyclohydrolase
LAKVSVNRNAVKLVRDLCSKADHYGVRVAKSDRGATLIDAGIEAEGSVEAGRAITEICLGGLGKATISSAQIGTQTFPLISVSTDCPAVSTLGSQLAGWQVKSGTFQALGSGPARALALKPKSVFEKIGYRDECDEAVLVLETNNEPPMEVISAVAEACHVATDKLHIILVPVTSVSGATQISGRVVETGIYRLMNLGFDPKLVTRAWGFAPVLPVHRDAVEAMGRSNDAVLYGGEVYAVVNFGDGEELGQLAQKLVSSSSKQYGQPFAEIFKGAGNDFYRIDPGLFAPAKMTLENAKSGRTFSAGRVNVEVLLRSINR